MALDQLKAFILKMQDDEELKQRVLRPQQPTMSQNWP